MSDDSPISLGTDYVPSTVKQLSVRVNKPLAKGNYVLKILNKEGKEFGFSEFKVFEEFGGIVDLRRIDTSQKVFIFLVEIYGRKLMGEGVLLIYGPEISSIPMLLKITNSFKKGILMRETKSIFEELGFDPSKPIREQEPNPLPDRKASDDIVFDALGLTEEERKEVYWSVAELVKNRLEKAKNV